MTDLAVSLPPIQPEDEGFLCNGCHTMTLPWPELEIPQYRPATLGPWSLIKCANLAQLGYFQDRQGAGDVYALLQNGENWMSTAWDEIESQAPHVAAATGHVVVMGAGLGIALYNILRKTKVQRVTLVERDPIVVDLLRQVTDLHEWTGVEKLDIEVIDAFDYVPREVVDHLYVDIWAKPGDPQALSDTQQIQKQVRAQTVGWWTQEIEFLQWLEQNGSGSSPTLEQYREWAREIGLPLIEQSNPVYPACVSQVARSYCYRMVLQRLAQAASPAWIDDTVSQDGLGPGNIL